MLVESGTGDSILSNSIVFQRTAGDRARRTATTCKAHRPSPGQPAAERRVMSRARSRASLNTSFLIQFFSSPIPDPVGSRPGADVPRLDRRDDRLPAAPRRSTSRRERPGRRHLDDPHRDQRIHRRFLRILERSRRPGRHHLVRKRRLHGPVHRRNSHDRHRALRQPRRGRFDRLCHLERLRHRRPGLHRRLWRRLRSRPIRPTRPSRFRSCPTRIGRRRSPPSTSP